MRVCGDAILTRVTVMNAEPPDACLRQVRRLIDRYRASCLWFIAADYYPATRAEVAE